MRAFAEELAPGGGGPDKFLAEINRRLLAILTQTRVPMFVSAFYTVIDLVRGECGYPSGRPAHYW